MAHVQQWRCLRAHHSHAHSVTSTNTVLKRLTLRLIVQARDSSTTAAAATPGTSTAGAAGHGPAQPPSTQFSKLIPRQATAMFASGAVLGPFCDGLHSQHDVLHYVEPSVNVHWQSGALNWSFETCWWVPLLFGLAGLILGVSVPVLDEALAGQQQQQQQPLLGATTAAPLSPSWAAVLTCISLFVTQYGLSGILEQPLLGQTLVNSPVPTVDVILCTYALTHWAVFDKTRQGFAMAALTAVCGPLVEIGLINGFGLYHYSHPIVFGVPTWIPWVYFCGGPAVGNLGRRVWQELKSSVS